MNPLAGLTTLAVSILWFLVWDCAGYAVIRSNVSTTNKRMAIAAWLLSCAGVILFPLLVPLQINTLNEWMTMRFGFPLSFVGLYPLPNAVGEFPFRTTFINEYSLTTGIAVNPLGYVINLIGWFAVLYFIGAVARKALLRAPAVQRLASQT